MLQSPLSSLLMMLLLLPMWLLLAPALRTR